MTLKLVVLIKELNKWKLQTTNCDYFLLKQVLFEHHAMMQEAFFGEH